MHSFVSDSGSKTTYSRIRSQASLAEELDFVRATSNDHIFEMLRHLYLVSGINRYINDRIRVELKWRRLLNLPFTERARCRMLVAYIFIPQIIIYVDSFLCPRLYDVFYVCQSASRSTITD